ncbi:cytosolic carboxypeptidase 4 [Aplochiton taeniatus]
MGWHLEWPLRIQRWPSLPQATPWTHPCVVVDVSKCGAKAERGLNAGDIESTLNILNVLDELLSAGTDRRIHYMISKGGSEALLAALVNTARTLCPNYTVLLPLLHLLAKVGQRDCRIGLKAEEAEAVLLTLKLLRQNGKHARRAAACLWVLKVYCSSVTTANLLGENQGVDVIFHLISPHTTNHHRTVKAAIEALAALLCSKANVRLAVAKGFVGGLLRLYESWHTKDSEHQAVSIRRALLRCLNQATHCRAGRQALVAQGGISLLYHTTQSCLMSKGLESLVEAAVQLMRKCCPKSPLPLTSDQSVYNLPLPGRPFPDAEAGLGPAEYPSSLFQVQSLNHVSSEYPSPLFQVQSLNHVSSEPKSLGGLTSECEVNCECSLMASSLCLGLLQPSISSLDLGFSHYVEEESDDDDDEDENEESDIKEYVSVMEERRRTEQGRRKRKCGEDMVEKGEKRKCGEDMVEKGEKRKCGEDMVEKEEKRKCGEDMVEKGEKRKCGEDMVEKEEKRKCGEDMVEKEEKRKCGEDMVDKGEKRKCGEDMVEKEEKRKCGEDMVDKGEKRKEDDDLETDLNKLRNRPEPDRPLELLGQYVRLCPELSHDFQELESGSEPEESSSDEELFKGSYLHHSNGSSGGLSPASSSSSVSPLKRQNSTGEGSHAPQIEVRDFHSSGCAGRVSQTEEGSEAQGRMVERLLEQHGACVPHHDPRLYRAAASATKSIPGYSILAFPDFWGHLPPPHHEPMAARKPNVQRQKVLEDIRRLLQPEDLLDQVVFDLEEPSRQCVSDRSDSLCFFSKFESGNLRKAIQVRRYEYDLILNADANCRQHTQWFYFEVSGMAPGVAYRFNVVNCEKGNSQFNYGMQPVLYSVREALEGRPQWVRTGTEICYYRNSFWPSRGRKRSSFYTLTFTITFKHNEDVCYLAYHYPYTYSALQSHLQGLLRSVDPSTVFFRQQSLCQTLGGNPCPLITITACPPSRSWKDLHQLRNRPCLVLSARVHPGESNASWVMKGTLEFLCSPSPVAQSLREAFVFKILPMLNPDGVVNGTHRCALNGADLNRQWMKPDPVLSPTIYHAKGFLYYLNSIGRTPLVFCDYHGHSRKKNVFLYGCSVKETLWQSGSAVSTAGLKEDPGYRTIPKTLDRLAPAFSFNSCNYQVEKSRSATARVVVWREMGVLRSYTMESTYNGCDQGVYKGLQIGTQGLEEMGLKFCQSLLSLQRNTSMPYNRRLINHIDLDHSLLDHKSHNSFEDDEPPCVEDIEYMNDNSPEADGTELDSDVNGNTSSGEEEEAVEEDIKGRGIPGRQQSRHSRLFPDLISKSSRDTRKSLCNGRNISSGHYLS